jgi:hypothetical protein
MEYFRELNWNLDISATGPILKSWCTKENGNYRYFQIHINRLCENFEVYRILRDKLLEQGLELYRSKFMQMNPGDFMKIHIDQTVSRTDLSKDAIAYYDESNAMKYVEVAKPAELSLNIPLANAGDHITRWYLPKDCQVNLRAAPCGPLPSIDLENWPDKDKLVEELCVASFRMYKPSLIRTDFLHNVDARHSKKIRWIMSFRLIDAKTKEFLTWNDVPRFESITF